MTYRRATESDAAAATEVNASAVNDLGRHRGFGDPPASPSPPNPFYSFAVHEQNTAFWIAEDDSGVVGFSLSLVYGSFWFLSSLFIRPTYQGRGVGRALIERALTHSDGTEITNRTLVTFAYNPTSISLYIRYGMYPRESIYLISGPREAIGTRLQEAQAQPEANLAHLEMRVAGYEATAGLSGIDEQVLGFPRDQLHRYLLGAPGSSCYLVRERGLLRGYVYIWANGRIGPLAAVDPANFPWVMSKAVEIAAKGTASEIFTIVAGGNEDALSISMGCGMRIVRPMLIMAARPFGHWDRYLFHSPGLL
jgi:ribosomal protein S18 acetylase RimI-like enzyme